MGRKHKYTVEQIAKELHEAQGQITVVADRLTSSYNTILRMVQKSSTLQEIIAHYKERRIDRAELKLEQAIIRGEPWAIALTLKTIGKARGYTERIEHTGADSNDVVIRVVRDMVNGSRVPGTPTNSAQKTSGNKK